MTCPFPNRAGTPDLPVKHYLLSNELANLERFTADILAARPESTREVITLRDRLFAWAEKLPPIDKPVPVHRDFYYSQVLVNGDQLTLIDFDLFALGDPAIDVANFVAHLYFLGLYKFNNLAHLIMEAASFMAVYNQYRPLSANAHQRLAFYEAATFFRLMNVVVSRPLLVHCFEPLMVVATSCLDVVPNRYSQTLEQVEF